MEKMLVFDMDGTIFDFYGVEGWLEDLQNERTRPYDEAPPMYGEELNRALAILRQLGWKICVTSWLSANATPDFKRAIRKSKVRRLKEINFPYDEIHLVQYGTNKASCSRKSASYQILIDDNASIREAWNLGATIDATENIISALEKVILETYFRTY